MSKIIPEKIRPTNDLLLIRRNRPEDVRSAGGLILPPVEESLDTPYTGTVIAAGPGKRAPLAPASRRVVDALRALTDACWRRTDGSSINEQLLRDADAALSAHADNAGRLPMQVRAGDVVVFSKHGHQEFKIGGEMLTSLQEASCLGMIEL